MNFRKVSGIDQYTYIKKALLLQTEDTHWEDKPSLTETKLLMSSITSEMTVGKSVVLNKDGMQMGLLLTEVQCVCAEILFLPEAYD